MREIRSPLDGIPSPFAARAALDAYLVGAYKPKVVADFAGIYSANEYYRTGGSASTFSDMFSYTGASNKTMTDSDGKLKWAPHNLSVRSEEFEDASWSKIFGGTGSVPVVNPNQGVAPDGTLTADRIQFDRGAGATISDYSQVSQSRALRGVHTFSVWVRSNTGLAQTVMIYLQNNSALAVQEVDTDWAKISVTSQDITSGTPSWNIGTRGGVYGGDQTLDILVWGAHVYRSDLGGMVNNPDRNDSYVPTTSSAVYLPRRNHYGWNGSTWVNKGLLLETESRTNLVTYSADESNGDWTNTSSRITVGSSVGGGPFSSYRTLTCNATSASAAQIFQIGKTLVSSSVYCAWTVVQYSAGNGWIALNMYDTSAGNVRAYFDVQNGAVGSKDAGISNSGIEEISSGWYLCWATRAVSSTSGGYVFEIVEADNDPSCIVNDAVNVAAHQYELGSTPSSYMPTTGSTFIRAAESLTIPAAKMAWDASNVSLQMQGEITYADEGTTEQQTFARWHAGATDYITYDLDTDLTDTGEVNFNQEDATGGAGSVAIDAYTPGTDGKAAYNISGRHTSAAINGATDGTATTEDTTPTALPDLSTTDFSLGHDYMGTIALFREDNNDWGDAGIEEAST